MIKAIEKFVERFIRRNREVTIRDLITHKNLLSNLNELNHQNVEIEGILVPNSTDVSYNPYRYGKKRLSDYEADLYCGGNKPVHFKFIPYDEDDHINEVFNYYEFGGKFPEYAQLKKSSRKRIKICGKLDYDSAFHNRYFSVNMFSKVPSHRIEFL